MLMYEFQNEFPRNEFYVGFVLECICVRFWLSLWVVCQCGHLSATQEYVRRLAGFRLSVMFYAVGGSGFDSCFQLADIAREMSGL